jgi:serine/threonine protein kinase/Tfp pilus assembly protein PilF
VAVRCPKCQHENPDDTVFCGKCGTQFPSPEEAKVTETIEAPKEELTTGSTFAKRYQIIEELGKGGMGRVYKATDTKIKEKVALKLIKPEIASDKKTLERFSNELRIARKITHKNVGKMFDINEEEGTHYITMEYVSGQDLKGLIRQSGRLAIETTLSIAKQVCKGLSEAHKTGVIHRDLKPSNIMIDREGNVRIMDFGIARSLKEKGITGAGVMIGTPEYMSPEQAEAKEVDQRSDIYSLGVILYEMVTGRVPFEGDTALSIAMRHKGEVPKDPKEYNAQIPDDLNKLILKCLEKDKDSRFQSADEILNVLTNIEKGIPTTQRIISERKPLTSREITVTVGVKRIIVPALIFIAIVIIGIAIWQLFPQKEAVIAPKIANSVAVISFENQTGDEAYDYLQKAIPNLLITNLENTGILNVATWERMGDLLKQMGQDSVDTIDRDTGFELCRREGIESIVLGSFIKAGDFFATDVKVLDVESKKLLKSASSRGEGIDSILRTQIDDLSREISEGIGITKERVESSKLNVVDVTTSSMEAYKYYLQGREAFDKFYYDDARRYLKKAIEIDPEFAVAHLYLGRSQGNLLNRAARNEEYIKAKELSANATEKERLFIEAQYAGTVEQDEKKRTNTLKKLAAKYPKEKRALYYLGVNLHGQGFNDEALEAYNKALQLDPNYAEVYNDMAYTFLDLKEYERALGCFEKYISLNPNDANPHDSMAELFFRLGQLDEAIGKYKDALVIKPDFLESAFSISYIYALKEDYVSSFNWIERLISEAPSPGLKSGGYLWKGIYLFLLGRRDEAQEQLSVAEAYAKEARNPFREFIIEYTRGWMDYYQKRFDSSRQHFQSGMDILVKLYPEWSGRKFFSGFTFGLLNVERGKIAQAQKNLEQLREFFLALSDSQKRELSNWDDYLSGKILLTQGSQEKAIPLLKNVFPDQMANMGMTAMGRYNFPLQMDDLARVYDQRGEWDMAIAEYQRLMNVGPDSENRRLINPIYHYRIAKLYEAKGWKGKAIEHYKKFLTLWKDADPGIAEVDDARKRVAGLKSQ